MPTPLEALIEWDGLRPHMLTKTKNGHPSLRAADLPRGRVQLAQLHALMHSKQRAPVPYQHTHGGPVISAQIAVEHFITAALGIFEGSYLNEPPQDYTALGALARARGPQAKAAAEKSRKARAVREPAA